MKSVSYSMGHRTGLPPTNCHLYHYAGNNPVRYVDSTGYDIEEIPIYSATAGLCVAGSFSAGLAIDSNGTIAIYAKVEGGVGAGASIGLDKLLSTHVKGIERLSEALQKIENTEAGLKILGTVVSLPEDTGKGNLSPGISIERETFKDWDNIPSVGAFFIGVEKDATGKTVPSIGIQVIAAAFLVSGTAYGTIYYKGWTSDFKEWLGEANEAFKNDYEYYEEWLFDYYTQDWYD